jgi:hypothetical protein
MNKCVLILTAVICAGGFVTRADLVVQQQITDTNRTRTAILKLHDEMLRLDQPEDNMSVIFNLKTRDSFTLLTTNNLYLRRWGNEVKWETEEYRKHYNGTNDIDQPPAPAVDTGKSEKFNGHDAKIFKWAGARGVTQTLWVDTNFPNYQAIRPQLARIDVFNDTGPHRNAQPILSRLPGMVLKTETAVRGAHVTNSLVSVKIESLDASLFVVPTNYTEWTRPEHKAGN